MLREIDFPGRQADAAAVVDVVGGGTPRLLRHLPFDAMCHHRTTRHIEPGEEAGLVSSDLVVRIRDAARKIASAKSRIVVVNRSTRIDLAPHHDLVTAAKPRSGAERGGGILRFGEGG
jgi:hypothetical protein